MKSIDEFDNIYTPDESIKSIEFDDGQGMLETYGQDMDTVLKISTIAPKKVWTAVDGDNGEILLINGLHYVNRIYYLITKEDAKEDGEEYVILEAEQMEE